VIFITAILRKPAAAIAAVLCMYGLEQWAQATSPFFVTHYKLINIVTGLMVVTALSIKVTQGRLNLSAYPRVGWVSLGLYIFAATTIVWAAYKPGLTEQISLSFPYLITIVVLMPLLVYDFQDLRTGMYYMLMIGSALVVLLSLTVEWTDRGVELLGVGDQRGNPLAVATMGGYVCIIAALMNFRGAARVWQLLRWPIMAFGVYLPIVSGSRGQLFGVIFVIMVLLPMSRRFANWRGFFTTVFAIGVLGAIVAWAYVQFATDARWDYQSMLDAYSESRLIMSVVLLKAWFYGGPVYWLLGMGNSASFAPWLNGIYPHIVMVEVLAEEGVIGFALLWTTVILSFRTIRRIYPYVKDNADLRGVLAATTGLLLFEVILSFKQGSLFGNTNAFAMMIILGRLELSILRPSGTAAGPVI